LTARCRAAAITGVASIAPTKRNLFRDALGRLLERQRDIAPYICTTTFATTTTTGTTTLSATKEIVDHVTENIAERFKVGELGTPTTSG
jgi:hypothetical protein